MKITRFIHRFIVVVTMATSLALAEPPFPAAISTQTPKAISTFECVGLYWAPQQGAEDNVCIVQYRSTGAEKWREGLPLSYDPRNREYRGSLVSLKPGTEYEARLQLKKSDTVATLKFRTWSETFPIARTVTLSSGVSPATVTITEGGTASGYILYVGAADGSTVIDVDNKAASCVEINASHVIVRGLTLKNASRDGVLIKGPQHDVVVENCDISGWGRIAADGWGVNMDAGVRAESKAVERIIIQRNKIHHPRSNSNDWGQPRVFSPNKPADPHPIGPQGIVMFDTPGNHVLRYNEVYSDESHRFNDGIGGGENFSYEGFPGPDSDVYGNYVANAADDALEIEGGGRNIRVWGNYLDQSLAGIASAANSVGPLYLFRNVYAVSRRTSNWSRDPHSSGIDISGAEALDNRGTFAKVSDAQTVKDRNGESAMFGGGRRYFFHNTILQPPSPVAGEESRGARCGIGRWAGALVNTVSRNNIYEVALIPNINGKTMSWSVYDPRRSPTNDLDYDLCNSEIIVAVGQETHAVKGAPIYLPGNGAVSGRGGRYELAPDSPGYGRAEKLPNFNDTDSGKAPDMGAYQSGAAPMEFGVNAYKTHQP